MVTSSTNSPDFIYTSLEICLRNITLYCRSLIEVLKREQQALTQGPCPSIQLIAQEKRALMDLIYDQESERRLIFRKITEVLNFSGNNLSLSQLVLHVGEPYASQLEKAHKELVDVLTSVFIFNHRSSTLLRHALYYNDCLLSLLSGYADIPSLSLNKETYTPTGKLNSNFPPVFGTAV